jgi:hypothetical protein
MSLEDCALSMNEGSAHSKASTCTGEHSGRKRSSNVPTEARTHVLEPVSSLLGQTEVKKLFIYWATTCRLMNLQELCAKCKEFVLNVCIILVGILSKLYHSEC